jgi:hypothetical protein
MAKRQSGAKAGLYACLSTMTMIEPSEQRTKTITVCARLIRVTESLFLRVFTWGKNPFSGIKTTWIKSVRQQKGPPLVEAGLSFIKISVSQWSMDSQL